MPEEPRTPVDPQATWPRPGAVVAAFGLGEGRRTMTPVGRAWSNRVFKLHVGHDVFALKELRNPWHRARWPEWIEASYQFERRAIEAGVRAPEPVPADGSFVAWVERQDDVNLVPVRVHRWVHGPSCPLGPVEPSVADWAGERLAILHSLGVIPVDRSLYPTPTTTANRWSGLVSAALQRGASWAHDLARLGESIKRAAQLAEVGLARADRAVISHGDIDQKNIVLGADGPVLCDWDVASQWAPGHELVNTAVSLGAAQDFEIARRVVTAYEQATGSSVSLDCADLAPSLMIGLDWVGFNVERAIGLCPATPAEKDLSQSLVPRLITEYRRAVDIADAVPELFGR